MFTKAINSLILYVLGNFLKPHTFEKPETMVNLERQKSLCKPEHPFVSVNVEGVNALLGDKTINFISVQFKLSCNILV